MKFMSREPNRGGNGFGLAYFVPYDFYSTASFKPSEFKSAGQIQVHTAYQEVRFGYGFATKWGGAFGFTVDGVSRTAECVKSGAENQCDDIKPIKETGVAGSAGFLGKWTNKNNGMMFRVGVNGRSEAQFDSDTLNENNMLSGLPGKHKG